jgi:hypothetical protein
LVIVGSNTFIHFASACFEKDREIIKLEVTTARISSKKKARKCGTYCTKAVRNWAMKTPPSPHIARMNHL